MDCPGCGECGAEFQARSRPTPPAPDRDPRGSDSRAKRHASRWGWGTAISGSWPAAPTRPGCMPRAGLASPPRSVKEPRTDRRGARGGLCLLGTSRRLPADEHRGVLLGVARGRAKGVARARARPRVDCGRARRRGPGDGGGPGERDVPDTGRSGSRARMCARRRGSSGTSEDAAQASARLDDARRRYEECGAYGHVARLAS